MEGIGNCLPPPSLSRVALVAVKKGMISVSQFATLLRLYDLKKKFKITATPLFLEDNIINPDAKRMIEETLPRRRIETDHHAFYPSRKITYDRNYKNFLNDQELVEVFSRMRSALPSEQVLFSYASAADCSKFEVNSPDMCISDFISNYGGG